MKNYKYVIIGGGICGCSTAFELSKYEQSILLVDKLEDVAFGASGAAGAFLSPLLGKPNRFKDLVTESLIYSTEFYKKNFPNYIDNCGTIRIPKDTTDQEKFQSYQPFMDFEYTNEKDGYRFEIGSVVQSYNICKKMVENIDTRFDYDVRDITFNGTQWIINNEISASNIILATGYENNLLDESYIQLRAVWGRRIDITSSTETTVNYHKECSVSKSTLQKDGLHHLSIGATHHRDKNGVENISGNHNNLLKKAKDIVPLEDITIIQDYVGARACSVDYFPMIGSIINSNQTLQEFPYLVHGTHVPASRFIKYPKLFIMNGVGGRGFVLGPYLAKLLVSYLINNQEIDKDLTVDRLFKRFVKKRD